MANRYVSYGYEITDGRIMVIEKEREIVINVYGMYINGHGLLEISNRLNQAGVSYNNDGRNWNKNIIKRMLENRKYLGEDCFPPIIKPDIFEKAEQIRLTKSNAPNERKKELNTIFRNNLICGCCGQRLDRYKGKCKSGYVYYRRCRNAECTKPATTIIETELEQVLMNILNDLVRTPEQVKADESVIPDIEDEPRLNIADEINNPVNEIKDIVAKIIEGAELRFEQCIEQDYTAIDENIRRTLNIRPEKDEMDIELFKSIGKIIRLYPNKIAEIELINGNRFTGGIENDR